MAEKMASEVVVSGGLKTEVKKRPFWVSEEEKTGLEGTPPDNLDVSTAVPELTWVVKGSVVGAYVRKDGLVVYHIYKKNRKEIYDCAHEEMDRIRREEPADLVPPLQNAVAQGANIDLDSCPWWPETHDRLQDIFQSHFKHSPTKITYYPEVDSWSVILPEPNMPGALTKEHLEAPLSKLALIVGG